MASTMRFDNWQTTDGTPIATTNTSGDITFAGAVAGAGKILQVVQTVKTDTFTTTSSSYVDITGLSVSITPTATSSKVLVIATIEAGTSGAGNGVLQLVRGATALAIGDTASNRTRATTSVASATNTVTSGYGISYLDSPATTSATTYKIQSALIGGSGGMFINRSSDDADANYRARVASTITVMEVSA